MVRKAGDAYQLQKRIVLDAKDQLAEPNPARLVCLEVDSHRPQAEPPHLVTVPGSHSDNTVIVFERTQPQTCPRFVLHSDEHSFQTR